MVRYLFYTIGDLTYQSPLVDFGLYFTQNIYLLSACYIHFYAKNIATSC